MSSAEETVRVNSQQEIVRSWVGRTAPLLADQSSELYFIGKRVTDFFLGGMMLVILTPLLVVIALLIRLESPGPALFVQERVGSRRRRSRGHVEWEVRMFRCYKFRSMVASADPALHQAYIRSFAQTKTSDPKTAGTTFKLQRDPRVTRVGRLLRKTSLDELPQLFNVLKGEMSLVGPRPVPDYEVAEYQEQHFERLAALPGITGFWQVMGRSKVTFEEMIRMDIEYVCARSLWLDFKILISTISAVLSGRGAE
jgi:lipopolysaccharide/colanic/teichoic acid biosynthesis glycosyltransferase